MKSLCVRNGCMPCTASVCSISGWASLCLPIRRFSTLGPLKAKTEPWSKPEFDKLQTLIRQGLSRREIALQMPQRSFGAIIAKAYLLSTSLERKKDARSLPARRRLWTDDEDAKLLDLHEQGVPTSHICAEFPLRSIIAVKDHLHVLLNKPEWNTSKSNTPWTEDEKMYAVDAIVNQNSDYRAVARKLQRPVASVKAIYQRACRQGQRRRDPDSRFWTANERTKLLELRNRGLTSREIAAALPGRSKNSVHLYVYQSIQPLFADATAARRYRREQRAKDAERIVALRESGESWASIHEKIPGRTLKAKQFMYYESRHYKSKNTSNNSKE